MGMSQSVLSKRSGVNRQTISLMVNGAAIQPSANQLGAVAIALGVEPNEIYQVAGWWVPDQPQAPDTHELADEAAVIVGTLPPDGQAVARAQLRALRSLFTPMPEEGTVDPMKMS